MKPNSMPKTNSKKNGYQSDDDNVRYKINTKYVNASASPTKKKIKAEDDGVRYKFPTILTKSKPEQKPKAKPKIKVNFWSNKPMSRLQNTDSNKEKINRRHTVAATTATSPIKPRSNVVKVRKRVSFLPTPLFSDNHVPMVTVPDDLTIQLNEEEANDLSEDLNEAFVNSNSSSVHKPSDTLKKQSRSSVIQTSPKSSKRKNSNMNYCEPRAQSNENELEFFSKYIVQKLRRMETNQRIYSENLINTVLMFGQLGKLNGKSKIGDA